MLVASVVDKQSHEPDPAWRISNWSCFLPSVSVSDQSFGTSILLNQSGPMIAAGCSHRCLRALGLPYTNKIWSAAQSTEDGSAIVC